MQQTVGTISNNMRQPFVVIRDGLQSKDGKVVGCC